MNDLIDYVQTFAIRGECQCGKCIDRKEGPDIDPSHSADLMFFRVHAAPGADKVTLEKLVRANMRGSYCNVDLFDGKEHGYMELGGWIGDQGLAMQLMGLGAVLHLWNLTTPRSVFGKMLPDEKLMEMAGVGYVTISAEKSNGA